MVEKESVSDFLDNPSHSLLPIIREIAELFVRNWPPQYNKLEQLGQLDKVNVVGAR